MRYLTAIALLLSSAAFGSVYKCEGPDGEIVFTDKGCGTLTSETVEIGSTSSGISETRWKPSKLEGQLLNEREMREASSLANRMNVTSAKAREMETKRIRCEDARETMALFRERQTRYGRHRDSHRTQANIRQRIKENC